MINKINKADKINRHGNSGVELSYNTEHQEESHLVCYCGFVTKRSYSSLSDMKLAIEEIGDHARTAGASSNLSH